MAIGVGLLRGAAVGVVGAVLCHAVAILIGIASYGSSEVYFAAAVLGGVAAWLPSAVERRHAGERRDLRIETVGALLVAGGVLASGVASGWGAFEYFALAGALLSAGWLATGARWSRPRWSPVWTSVVGTIVLLVYVLGPFVADGGPLGHDESAYALEARHWLEGTPETGWAFHRGLGMSVYGMAVLSLGGSEGGLRLIGLAGVIALVVATFQLGRRMWNPAAGAVASVAVVAAPLMLRAGTEYLSDVPSAALLTFVMVIVWNELERRSLPTYRLLWAVPLGLAAFYLRYQSLLSLGLIALSAVCLWPRKLRDRPGPVLVATALGLAGMIPHALTSIELTGRPLGILLGTNDIVGSYLGEGLVDYLRQVRFALAGWAGPFAFLLAVVGAWMWWREESWRRRLLFLVVPALLQTLVLGVFAHGEPRFIFFPITLVVVAGAMSAQRWLTSSDRKWAAALGVFLTLILVASLALSVASMRRGVRDRIERNERIEIAALHIADQAGNGSCGVMTTYTAQATFYSGCASSIFRPDLDPQEALALLPGESRFMVLLDDGLRQPTGPDLDGLIALTGGDPVRTGSDDRAAFVYRFAE